MTKKVLFLCTGNYYRSRFAENLFNALAFRENLDWNADSRGLALGTSNVGPIYPGVLNRLKTLGFPAPIEPRFPARLEIADLETVDLVPPQLRSVSGLLRNKAIRFEAALQLHLVAALVIALNESEHRPLMSQRFERWADQTQYWDVPDLNLMTTEDAFSRIEKHVTSLIRKLQERHAAPNPTVDGHTESDGDLAGKKEGGKMALTREDILTINQKGWNIVAPQFYSGTALPRYGPLADTEDDVQLLDDLKDKSVLEIGCGSGHTLQYFWKEKQAGELWGMDVSQEQLRFTSELLATENIPARLFLSSMDENPGIPESHFDLVISIYALGWTPDLPRTLALIYSYLKPGGRFIFSWEHPVYQCLEYDSLSEKYYLKNSYLDESPDRKPSWRGVEIVLQPRMLSTYLNALCSAGFRIERLVESEPNLDLAREEDFAPEKWYSVPRAQMIPTTLIVKASKPL